MGESPRGGRLVNGAGDWGQRTLSRTCGRERMSALGGGSPRGREAGQWRGGLGSTGCVAEASRGQERMSALGGRVHAGGRLVNGARDLGQRTLSRTRGRERMVRFGRESPRGREEGQWRGGFGQPTASRRKLTDGNGCPLWERESPRGREDNFKPDMSPRIHD